MASDETPQDPQGTTTATDKSGVEGQVSEVSGMSGEPDAISPADAVTGTSQGESGKPDEGEAGPNAKPEDNVRSNRA